MRREELREPTGDECNSRAKILESEDRIGYAVWYPQMGGYVGKAVVVFFKGERGGCFEAYVWHDGEFPFVGQDSYGEERSPACIHHCCAEQFIEFGRGVVKLMAREGGEK